MARTRFVLLAALCLVATPSCKKKPAPADAGAAPTAPTKSATTAPTTAAPASWQAALKSADAKVRAEGCEAISPSDHAAPPPELVAVLGDPQPAVRKAATRAVLGFILQNDDTSALPKLLELAEKDADTEVRAEAVRALGALTHRDVVPVFVRLHSSEKDPAIKEEIVASFAKTGDSRALPAVVELLKGASPPAGAFEAVKRVATAAPQELVKLLAHTAAATRRLAAGALGEIGDRSVGGALAKAAADADPEVAAEALGALALLGGPDGVAPILAACDHPNARIKGAAVRALATYRSPEDISADAAFDRIKKVMSGGPAEVRIQAMQALAGAKLKRSIPILRETAGKAAEPMVVRVAAVKALGEIGDATVAAFLTTTLGDKDPDVRTAAAKALGDLGEGAAQAGAALIAAWKRGEADIDARIEIVKALGMVGAKDAAALLKEIGEKDEVPIVRAYAGGALLRLGRTEGATTLRPILTGSKEWEERRAAARLLETRSWRQRKGEKITPEQQALVGAVTGLVTDALKTEKEPLVREVLYRQLMKARGPSALPAQRDGLKERVPFFRIMAAAGLCRNGDTSGCSALVAALDHPESAVRAEAARRCGYYRVQAAEAGLRKASEDPALYVANAARRALSRITELAKN